MVSDIESKSNNKITNILQESKQLNDNQYKMILNEVNSLCHDGKIYDQLEGESYAEPCQSYRNYKTQFSAYASTPHKSEENSGESKVCYILKRNKS